MPRLGQPSHSGRSGRNLVTESVFIQPLPQGVAAGDSVQLTGSEARHSQVKRIADGEAGIVSDDVDTPRRGTVAAAGGHVSELQRFAPPAPGGARYRG